MINYKTELFNSLFQKRILSYQNSRDKKFIDTKIIFAIPALESHVNTLYKKYSFHTTDKDAFISEYIYWCYKAIDRFEITQEEAQAVINGYDKETLAKIIKNIKVTTSSEMYRYANPHAKFTRGEIDGKKQQHIVLKLQIDSLDSIIDTNNHISIDEVISNKNVLHNNITYKYYINYFSKWFNENKEYILTKSQLKLLEDLKQCKKVDGYTINDIEEHTGVPSHKVNSRLKRIEKRIINSWKNENGSRYRNRLEMIRDEKMELLNEYILIAYSEDNLATQNTRLTNWIKSHHTTSLVMDLLDEIYTDLEEQKSTNRILTGKTEGNIATKTLSNFLFRVEDELERLELMDCTVEKLKVEKKENKKLPKISKVYIFNEKQELQRVIEDSEKPKRKANIIYTLPNQLQIKTDGKLTD